MARGGEFGFGVAEFRRRLVKFRAGGGIDFEQLTRSLKPRSGLDEFGFGGSQFRRALFKLFAARCADLDEFRRSLITLFHFFQLRFDGF